MGAMLGTLAILLLYAVFCADAWLAPHLPATRQYYWLATTAMLALYSVVLGAHGSRWQALESRIQSRVSRIGEGWSAAAVANAGCALITVVALADAALRMRRIAQSPIKVTQGDMLPLLQAAVRTFVSGANPYRAYHVPWEIHLTYYPGLWLPYLPAELLRLDYRYVGVTAILGVAIIFAALIKQEAARGKAALPFVIAATVLFCAFVLNAKSRGFTLQMHTPPLWFYLAVFCVLALRRHDFAASLALGWCCASRISFVVLVPFWIVYVWRTEPRSRLRHLFALALAPVVLLLPFVLLDAREFWFGTVQWYWISSARAWQWLPDSVLNSYGLTSMMLAAGKIVWIQMIQLVLLTGITVVGATRVRDLRACFRWMNWALLAFSMTALVPYDYIYLECFLLLSFAALQPLAATRGAPQVPGSASFV